MYSFLSRICCLIDIRDVSSANALTSPLISVKSQWFGGTLLSYDAVTFSLKAQHWGRFLTVSFALSENLLNGQTSESTDVLPFLFYCLCLRYRNTKSSRKNRSSRLELCRSGPEIFLLSPDRLYDSSLNVNKNYDK